MIWALAGGYIIGSIPSADLIGRVRGIDVRRGGSGNPGTANALRLGGSGTAGLVLLADLSKGAAAASAGWVVAGDAGAIGGGLAAVAGQIFNPWFWFRGGKGLGVTGGMTLVVWPTGVLVVLPILAMAAWLLGSARGGLIGLGAYLAGAIAWASAGWTTGWGVEPDDRLVWAAIGVVALATPKFVAKVLRSPR